MDTWGHAMPRRLPIPKKSVVELKGLYGKRGKERPTRPTVCKLSPTLLGQIILNDTLDQMPEEGIPAELRELKRQVFKRCFNGRMVNRDMAVAVERITKLGYKPQILLTRKEAALAYRILVDVIGAL